MFFMASAMSASVMTCSDETRFQGIATPFIQTFVSGGSTTSPCSDETRFQGIATYSRAGQLLPAGNGGLAVTRPVFRGLRP